MKRIIPYVFFAALMYLTACNSLEYSPNQITDNNSPRDLNNKNIERLLATPGDDTIRVVLCGDSQRQYSDSEDLVKTVNAMKGVDFVILNGDISDFGLLQEMEWINRIFSKLTVPYIGVLGNHDMEARGQRVFEKMFGKPDYSFVYQGVKFVCHNTNSRQVNFNGSLPDTAWLSTQFKPEAGVNAYVAVAHVPPIGSDFDSLLFDKYVRTINHSPNTLAALYAHTHSRALYYPMDEPIPYLVTNAIENREFELIEIVNGKLSFRTIDY